MSHMDLIKNILINLNKYIFKLNLILGIGFFIFDILKLNIIAGAFEDHHPVSPVPLIFIGLVLTSSIPIQVILTGGFFKLIMTYKSFDKLSSRSRLCSAWGSYILGMSVCFYAISLYFNCVDKFILIKMFYFYIPLLLALVFGFNFGLLFSWFLNPLFEDSEKKEKEI